MSLSIKKLQSLLREEAEAQAKEVRAQDTSDRAALRRSIHNVWAANGLVATDPISPLIQRRPLPDCLFQSHLSEPQTTLMQFRLLPGQVQLKISSTLAPDSDALVEVPITYLEVEIEDHQGEGHGLANLRRRRLGGNLTNKLSEYTRGAAGQSRPFRPGGLDGDEQTVEEVDEYRSAAAIARSQRVLEHGASIECWRDGTLIRAPPGVDFDAGLTWKDVHGEVTKGDDVSETTDEVPLVAPETQELGDAGVVRPRQPPSSTLFDRNFFDDDSLFGSSSESEDEGASSRDEGVEEVESSPQLPSSPNRLGHGGKAPALLEDPPLGDEDIDGLLAALTETADETPKVTKRKHEISTNPLELAERQTEDQKNSTRKLWANEKLLPIRDFNALIPNPAMTFPFTLDDFQQQAVARLERNESVFVAAHTSAGKTVVAEYAVALAKQRATRCIYTSPIKALSNQKFRDFSLKFGSENVGLVTGDLQVNVDDSTCLIMTTEILRSMLYRGADLIRDLESVIFDEVHYVNDTERGVVWEEVIIMLPSYVNLIFLSATTPNTVEFSDWIGRTKRKPVHVIRTDYRPVPLSHNLWAGLKLHKVMEGKGGFLESGYREAANALLPSSAKDPNKKDQKGRPASRPATGSKHLAWQAQGSKQNWMSLVRFLDRELLTPTVVFSFSKKKCEEIANMLRSLDLNTAREKSAVQAFAIQTVARLSQNDAKLPQVLTICEMVQRGIGVHHGGLLPILKEMVEILFSRNLIKVLFATETFAMGVNMPARAVVFNSIRKHDGNQFRILEPGEYTQMAGRAGRRGLDSVGTVILCCFGEEPPPQQVLKHMLTGSSTRLSSQFRLTYNMILNLLRVEEMSVESMIARSFSEFATQRALTANEYPQLLARGERTLVKLEEKFAYGADSRVGVEDIESYFRACHDLMALNREVLGYIREQEAAALSEILQPGRVLLVSAARRLGCARAPAIVLRSEVSASSSLALGTGNKSTAADRLTCMILLPSSYLLPSNGASIGRKGTVGYIGSLRQRFYTIREVDWDQILLISSTKHKIDPKSLLNDDVGTGGAPGSIRPGGGCFGLMDRAGFDPFAGMKAVGRKEMVDEERTLSSKAEDGTTSAVDFLLDAEASELRGAGVSAIDLRSYVIRGNEVVLIRQRCDQIDDLVVAIRSFHSHRHPTVEKHLVDVERIETLRAKVSTLRHLLSDESLQLFPDFLQRKRVLQKLGYIDLNETVCVKGRVACEVNTCESLIVTEMVFEGLFNDLEPEEIVAVLSALVDQAKSDEEMDSELPEKLLTCIDQMKRVATNLGQMQKEQGLEVDPAEYCEEALKFGLVHVVYEWALGVPFKNICDLTDAQEGSIVRCITRLDELCREVRNCARVVGNPTLYRKLEAASAAIKRDIVFASSLYVS